jgi:hypothetical protein
VIEQNYEGVILAYGQCFSSEAGRVVLEDLKKSLANRSSFVAGKPDVTAFHEGQRDVVLRIEALIAEAARLVAETLPQ